MIKMNPPSNLLPQSQLDKAALLAGNLAKILEVLQQGLASQVHQDFVQQLASKGRSQN